MEDSIEYFDSLIYGEDDKDLSREVQFQMVQLRFERMELFWGKEIRDMDRVETNKRVEF